MTTSASTTSTSSCRRKRMKKGSSRGRPRAQPHAARRGHAVRRQADRRLPGRRDRRHRQAPRATASSTAPAQWIPLATRRHVSHVPGMTAEEVYVFTRLAGDKVGATKMDRPEDVEPSPAHRPCLRRADQQHRPRQGRQGPGRRGQPAQPQQARPDPGARRALGRPGRRRLRLAALPGRGRPERPRHLLRGLPEGEGQPHLLPGQRRLRPARQPVDLHGRQPAGLPRRPVRCRDRRASGAVSSSSS